MLSPFGHRALWSMVDWWANVLQRIGFHPTARVTENLLLKRFKLSSPQVKRVDSVTFSIHLAREPHSQRWNKMLISEYDFAVNVAMVISIAIHK